MRNFDILTARICSLQLHEIYVELHICAEMQTNNIPWTEKIV